MKTLTSLGNLYNCSGLKISKLVDITGIKERTLYGYLYGQRSPTDETTKEKLKYLEEYLSAICKLNVTVKEYLVK